MHPVGGDRISQCIICSISQFFGRRETTMNHEEQPGLLIRNSADIITVLDHNQTRVFVSESVTGITGYLPEELIGEPFDSLVIHPDDLIQVQEAIDRLIAVPEVQTRIVYRHRHKHDGYIYIETIATNLLNDPQIHGVLMSSRNCSEMILAEARLHTQIEDLKRRNTDLETIRTELITRIVTIEEQLREQIRDGQEKRVEIDQLLKQKDEFIYQLAHDLRTPLTPVVAMLPLLAIGIQDPDAKSLLEIFGTSIQNLQKMVEDIIYYSQLNKQFLITDYTTYSLLILIDEAIEANSFMAVQKELDIQVNIPEEITINASRAHARQLFSNLINNAVKYNVYKGLIRITAIRLKNGIEITIADTGIGIAETQIDRIWDEFTTGDMARKDPSSKGLGLPIVRQIISLHQGTIRVSSEGIGKGATFRIWFPDSPS
ncbi:MAG: PAS domain-containing sensor histidine kinase [Methanospirillum sp.]|uniref:PAS domain-containing sensor histidine kinase n=1 Tax=Methanospirillum sp. TaxID=45200 RepID=UPI00236D8DA4|nr:PAS domain-containing sensor histidine kinase [Methanospirillum sp.]MDD1729407.1 PAS domain-containing sensor histidine kinase [Methanospirillum sp.]